MSISSMSISEVTVVLKSLVLDLMFASRLQAGQPDSDITARHVGIKSRPNGNGWYEWLGDDHAKTHQTSEAGMEHPRNIWKITEHVQLMVASYGLWAKEQRPHVPRAGNFEFHSDFSLNCWETTRSWGSNRFWDPKKSSALPVRQGPGGLPGCFRLESANWRRASSFQGSIPLSSRPTGCPPWSWLQTTGWYRFSNYIATRCAVGKPVIRDICFLTMITIKPLSWCLIGSIIM